MVTDGYLVVGGGTSADISFIPQDMPDPARPNNVIAPYWTDLTFDPAHGGGAGAAYAASFTCSGTPCAYEFEWAGVPIYGTGQLRTFAVWMYMDDFLSSVSYPFDNNEMVYDTAGPSADNTPLNVGAEDALGLTAAQLGVDTTDTTAPDPSGYFVTTGFSSPGGSLTIDYDVLGKHVGAGHLRALMDSDQTVGSAKIVTDFNITH